MTKDRGPVVPGPRPDRVKIDGDWEPAVKKALEKERPEEGWLSPKEMQPKEKGQEDGNDAEYQG